MKIPIEVAFVLILLAFCLGVGTTCALRWKSPFMEIFNKIEDKVGFGIPPAIPV